jgi:PAS domain S-box-containing protein
MTDKQIKVLMIEDNPGDILLIREMFKEVDISLFDLETASCLKAGLEKIKKTLYDVILLDLGLPDSRGLETFIKVNVQKQEVPIIVLTGLADETLALDAIKRGAQDYLVKEQLNTSRLATSISYAIERKKTERRLVKSEQWFRMLIETSPEVVTATDLEGRITYVSPRTLELHGFKSSEELIGKNALELISPEDHERALKNFQITLKDGILKNEQYTLVKKDGTRFIGELSSALVCDIEGELKGFVAITRDITERKRAEEALKKSEEHFRDLVEKSRIAISSDDSQGNLIYFNERYAEIFGYSMEEMIKKPVRSLVHPEDREKVATYHEGRLRNKNVPSRYEFRGIRKDGSVRYLEVDVVDLRVGGRFVGTRTYLWDITDRKLSEEALQKRNVQLELIHHIQSEIPVNTDIETVLVQTAESIGKSFGYYKISVNLYDRVTEEIEYLTGWNKSGLLIPRGHRQKLGQGLIGKAGLLKQTIVANDVSKEPDYITYYLTETKAELIIPLVVQDQLIGVLDLQSTQLNAFSKDDVSVLQAITSYIAHIINEKQKREGLRESEQKFRNLAEQTPNMIFINQEGRVVFANKKCEEIMGYQREEIYSPDFDFLILIAPGDRDKIKANFAKNLRGEETSSLEHALLTKEGKKIEAILATKLIEYGGEKAILGTVTDITELKRAEKALRESEEKYRNLFEEGRDSIVVASAEAGIVIDCNRAATLLWGREKSELVGQPQSILHPPETIKYGTTRSFQQHLREKEGQLLEEQIVTKNGEIRNVEIMGSVFELGGRRLIQGIFRDITERKRAEEELKKSEERFRLVFESAPDAYYLNDLKGNFIDGNKAAEKLTGYKREEFVGMSFLKLNLLSAEFIPKAAYLLVKNLRGKPTGPDELILKRKDGSKVAVEISTHPVKFEGKAVVLGIARDITERKKGEQALKENEEKYRTLTENINIGVFRNTAGPKNRFIEANPALVRMFGYKNRKAFLALNLSDLYQNVEDRERLIEKLLTKGFSRNEEVHVEKKDGNPIICSVSAVAVKDEQGSLQYFDGTIEDITERKRAEEELQESEEKYRTLVENAAEAILIAQDGMMKFVNRMASEITGYSEQELRSSPFLEFIHPDDRQMVGERYLRRLNGDVSLPRYAFRLINKDGSIKWVEIGAVLVAWEDKPATLNFLSDITERKRAEEELNKHREHLEELVKERTRELEEAKIAADAANRAKSVFLANMSHEIRTPMNAILGFSQLMQRDDTLNPQQWKHLDIINRSGEHLIALINDILEMSKIEAGRTTLNPTIFNLRALLEDLEMMFRVRTDAKKLNFSVEGLGQMPNYVVGDQSKLLQVFINLLGNAVKFTEKGGVVLRVRVKQEDSDRLRLLAEVEDTGPGIPETELNNLFKPFLQTQNSRRAGSGTGLGLAISKEFVRLMGGDITVGSKEGTGSLFKFDLQLRESETGSDEKKPESARVRGLRPGQPTYRILIADDEETNLVMASRMLGNTGFETRQATNGEEAVETFRAWQPHLIFMDMRMPVMDGFEAIRRIRAGAGGQDVKIISVSASAFSQNRREALQAGADDFIAKPFREAVLFEMIGKLLGIEYVLSDEAGPAKLLPSAAVMSAMTAEVLSALPEESINKMRDAVISADFDLMMELVGGVEGHNILVAQELRSLIERFKYTEFLELLQTGRNAR